MEMYSGYKFLTQDQPSSEIMTILGKLPDRWGRMDQISRLVLVEVGRTLKEYGLLESNNRSLSSQKVGLVVGTRRGSLTTDLAYCDSLQKGLNHASPALFSYTLANISLAEAAVHYCLTGPVYALFSKQPYEDALQEAKRWLNTVNYPLQIVAGKVDVLPDITSPLLSHKMEEYQTGAKFVVI